MAFIALTQVSGSNTETNLVNVDNIERIVDHEQGCYICLVSGADLFVQETFAFVTGLLKTLGVLS